MAQQAQWVLSASGRRVPEEEGTPLPNRGAEGFGCPFREWQGAKHDVLTGHKTPGSHSSRQQCPTLAAACTSPPRAQPWETSLQVTRELYLKSPSHDPSAAGKQSCRHKDDFILPAELLHRDCPSSPVPLAGAGSSLRQNNKFSQEPKAGRRSCAFLGTCAVLTAPQQDPRLHDMSKATCETSAAASAASSVNASFPR